MESLKSQPGRLLLALALAMLAIFAGILAAVTLHLRGQLRAEVLQREAEAIRAVVLMQIAASEDQPAIEGSTDAWDGYFAAVLESARLRGVLAVQLFDAAGRLRDWLPRTGEQPGGLTGPVGGDPQLAARFIARGALEPIFGFAPEPDADSTRIPLLEVLVPLESAVTLPGYAGLARYWIDGASVAGEFARMDRRLAMLAGVAFGGGALLVALLAGWAARRLALAHRELLEQGTDLARANLELDFAARTGALGAISAHLIHGLKNPLAGLEGFVAETAEATANAGGRGEACRTAVETTRRLRALVNEVVTVLRDETGGDNDAPFPVADLVEGVRQRFAARAEASHIELTAQTEPGLNLTARAANLAGLVLANVITNALEATPVPRRITLEARRTPGGAEFLVSDNGPGLPAAFQAEPFRLRPSNKPGGAGLGLAISQRLAKHAAGDLELVRSDAQGTVFRLRLPLVSTVPLPTNRT